MKAVRLNEIGGPANLRIEDVPKPSATASETVVRIRAAALNHRDVFISQGLYPNIALPRTLGSDGAGVEEATQQEVVINPMLDWGDDARVWSSSATILGMPRDGTFAQYVAVPAANVAPKPAHLSFEEAAALPLGGLTAYRATFTRGELQKEQSVLITGVGGGVQTFVLLFAKAAGARIAVTSSSDEKLERARALGADHAANYRTDENWHKTLRKQAGPFDLVIDSAGGDAFANALTLARPGGRMVTYGGTHAQSTVRMYPIFWNQLTILGTSMGSPQDFHAMLNFVGRERIVPVVDRVFPLEDAAAAAQRLNEAEQFGKIVLSID